MPNNVGLSVTDTYAESLQVQEDRQCTHTILCDSCDMMMGLSGCGLDEDCEWENLGACVLNKMQMHY